MKYKIITSDKTFNMLYKHLMLTSQVSEEAAFKEKEKIINAIASLEESPERYPFLYNDFILPNKYHKMLIDKRYFVLYQIGKKTVLVDYIADTRDKNTWLRTL